MLEGRGENGVLVGEVVADRAGRALGPSRNVDEPNSVEPLLVDRPGCGRRDLCSAFVVVNNFGITVTI
jgi:hypothetical protein